MVDNPPVPICVTNLEVPVADVLLSVNGGCFQTSMLAELGARCRGNQHDDVIRQQATAIADMRVRISDLEACVRQLNSEY